MEEIIKYVLRTPWNTNPVVLRSLVLSAGYSADKANALVELLAVKKSAPNPAVIEGILGAGGSSGAAIVGQAKVGEAVVG